MPKSCFLIVLLALAVCASGATLEPPKLRLGEDVRPVRYRADLVLVPDQDTFAGSIDIDLDILKPADVIWLNARFLTIDHAATYSILATFCRLSEAASATRSLAGR